MISSPENILLIGSVLLLISIIGGNVSSRFGMPTLILFLIVGILAGSEGIGGIYFDNPKIAQLIGVTANRMAWNFTFHYRCIYYCINGRHICTFHSSFQPGRRIIVRRYCFGHRCSSRIFYFAQQGNKIKRKGRGLA